MKTYTAILLSTLLGFGFTATQAKALEYQSGEQLLSTSAQHMLSAQTQQKGERAPERGSGRKDFVEPNVFNEHFHDF